METVSSPTFLSVALYLSLYASVHTSSAVSQVNEFSFKFESLEIASGPEYDTGHGKHNAIKPPD